jgi:hypothetical protein
MRKDFLTCSAFIYSEKGEFLTKINIREYDRSERYIVIPDTPVLDDVKRCEVLIIASPAPYAYKGTIHTHNYEKIIKLYRETKKDNRIETRFNIEMTATVGSLIYSRRTYPMHTPIEVELVNISKNGVRFRSEPNDFYSGNVFNIYLKTGRKFKLLTAEVVNVTEPSVDFPFDFAEFGCRFVNIGHAAAGHGHKETV